MICIDCGRTGIYLLFLVPSFLFPNTSLVAFEFFAHTQCVIKIAGEQFSNLHVEFTHQMFSTLFQILVCNIQIEILRVDYISNLKHFT